MRRCWIGGGGLISDSGNHLSDTVEAKSHPPDPPDSPPPADLLVRTRRRDQSALEQAADWFNPYHHRWQLVALSLFLILLPFLIPLFYRQLTGFPRQITITTGSQGGLYRGLSESLAEEIERRLSIEVKLQETTGTLENLFYLQAGKAAFGFYQPGTLEVLRQLDPVGVKQIEARILSTTDEPRTLAFVANVYSQPAHVIVHLDTRILELADLQGMAVSLGLRGSGDHSMGRILLDVFDLEGKVETVHLSYDSIAKALPVKAIDAAIITVGTHAPVFRELAATGKVRFIGVPNAEALSQNYLFIYPYEIPAGLYGYLPQRVPGRNVSTVAAGAQVLTRTDVSSRLVEEVTKILLDQNYIKEQHLEELFAGGQEFALKKPEFPIHAGAQGVYEPGLRPLIDPDLVSSTEGLRSFVFSAIIALFVGIRWLKRRREHKLEQYIQSLLNIEGRHQSVGGAPDSREVEVLYGLLREVIVLKQTAFTELTAHELSDDRAANCFLLMCQDLSTKINAKLSRQVTG